LRECIRAANKSNRGSTRARVNSLIREGSKEVRESMANMTLPENKQAQHEKELRECGRFAKLSNISARVRINSPSREKSKQDSERQ